MNKTRALAKPLEVPLWMTLQAGELGARRLRLPGGEGSKELKDQIEQIAQQSAPTPSNGPGRPTP